MNNYTTKRYLNNNEPTSMISLDYDFKKKGMNYNPKQRAKIGLETREQVRKCKEMLEQKTEKGLRESEEAKRATKIIAHTIMWD